jgi:SAM-dependent methyltransferase
LVPSSTALAALRCPACGTSPAPDRDDCVGCGRTLRSQSGGLDLLADDLRGEADLFAREYAALRVRESWAERDRLRRASAVASAVDLMRGRLGGQALIVDIGSGPALEPGVLGIDIAGDAEVRGDMRRLPLRDSSVDGALYAASLHYAPLDESLPEAARILRAGGVFVAIDSPLYRGSAAALQAVHRSAAYYEAAGHPALEAHYHPIERDALTEKLTAYGFAVERLETGSRWGRLLGQGPSSFVLARRLR